ncbi:hypothetical protein BaRGS_00033411 [Batillaria attramentaria]|uniref:Uncharacterized protein n=1 Tax=Batillaria attramentaria TaxID=370345 RepID=A0ABD0JKT7_9CAEN
MAPPYRLGILILICLSDVTADVDLASPDFKLTYIERKVNYAGGYTRVTIGYEGNVEPVACAINYYSRSSWKGPLPVEGGKFYFDQPAGQRFPYVYIHLRGQPSYRLKLRLQISDGAPLREHIGFEFEAHPWRDVQYTGHHAASVNITVKMQSYDYSKYSALQDVQSDHMCWLFLTRQNVNVIKQNTGTVHKIAEFSIYPIFFFPTDGTKLVESCTFPLNNGGFAMFRVSLAPKGKPGILLKLNVESYFRIYRPDQAPLFFPW